MKISILTSFGCLFIVLITLGSTEAQNSQCFSEVLANPELLLPMIMATGKGLNDMGDFDACNMNPSTEYALIYIPEQPFFLGTCVPASCDRQDLQILADGMSSLIHQIGMPPSVVGDVHIPSKDPITVSGWQIVGFIVFGFIAILLILGLLVEYTPLMGQVPLTNESLSETKKDKMLVASKSLLGRSLLAFSPSRNLKKMFYTPQRGDDYLTVLNGIRVISLYFVVLGHTNTLMMMGGITNLLSAQSLMNSWWIILICIGFYSVDVFFFISAFLATYLMTSKFHGKRFFNIPMVYLHRLIRVLPTILLLFVMYFTFLPFIGSGPIWKPSIENDINNCKLSWWPNVIFISSWYTRAQCFGHLWYLSNDMTFFLFVPLVVLAYLNSKLIGYSFVIFLNIFGIVLPFIFSHIRGHTITMLKDQDVDSNIELNQHPYNRSASYSVGLLFGLLYFEWAKSKTDPTYQHSIGTKFYNLFSNSSILCVLSFVLSSCAILFFIMFPAVELLHPGPRRISQIPSDFFNAFHRSIFSTALGLFLAPLFVGKLSLIKDIFGGKLWAPWAKVSFVSYLIHIHVMAFFYLQSKGSLYFDGPSQIFYSLATLLIVLLVSVPVALIIESPVLQLERLVLFPPKQSPSPLQQEILLKKQTKINKSDSSQDSNDA
ncbi:unnamed protein product [Moneuplotes crassus]|uniref:Acyltransferase 3 domain-containing protein n=1 Tax=Euplotes crassus TaxID=5936 RepID=A0AAD1X512_EUPCR|nr:unnamed protein product [Moneuplotes crassus]